MISHTPEHLFKFCTTDTAKQILEQGSLRWSAPAAFNDPFELDHKTTLSFSSSELLQAVIQTATAMIFAKDEPRGNSPLVNAIRRWRSEERFASPEEAHGVLSDLMSQVVTSRQADIETLINDWRTYSQSVRICCFSSNVDNPTAWRNFSDKHRGIALRFESDEESTLPKPHKVQYRKIRPEVTTLQDEVSHILNGSSSLAQEHFQELLIVKPDFCSNEQEWRCFQTVSNTAFSDNDDELYSSVSFQGDLTAIYFGVDIDADNKKQLLLIIKKHQPKIKIYQAALTPGKFELHFERL